MPVRTVLALAALALAVILTACGPQDAEDAAEPGAENWAAVQELKPQIEAKKAERDALIAEADAETDEDAEVPDGETARDIEAEIDEAGDEIAALNDQMYTKIVAYLNDQGMVEGAELTADQKEAFRLKTEIDLSYAQEYVDEAGNYRKAIDIYDGLLLADPENEMVLAAKAETESLRYMSQERFETVKKNTTQGEVRRALGTPRPSNIREFPERKRVGWFYPKDPETGGGAAGIFFKEKGKDSDVWIVESMDFSSVKSKSTDDDG